MLLSARTTVIILLASDMDKVTLGSLYFELELFVTAKSVTLEEAFPRDRETSITGSGTRSEGA